MKAVFLSHSQRDQELAEHLAADLAERGLTVSTLDVAQAGDDLPGRIADEVKKADAFIALVTPDYLRSRWAVRELEVALTPSGRRTTRVIPVIFRGEEDLVLPPVFGDVAQVDLAADYEKGLDEIVAAVLQQRRPRESTITGELSSHLFQVLVGLGLSAASTVAASAVKREPTSLLVPVGTVASLTALVAILSSFYARRAKAPVQIVRRNVEAAFVDALEESALNPLRGGARRA